MWKRRGDVGGLPRAGPDIFLHHTTNQVRWHVFVAIAVVSLTNILTGAPGLDLHRCNSHRYPVLYIHPQMGPVSLPFTLRGRSPLLLRIIGKRLGPLMGYPWKYRLSHSKALS